MIEVMLVLHFLIFSYVNYTNTHTYIYLLLLYFTVKPVINYTYIASSLKSSYFLKKMWDKIIISVKFKNTFYI